MNSKKILQKLDKREGKGKASIIRIYITRKKYIVNMLTEILCLMEDQKPDLKNINETYLNRLTTFPIQELDWEQWNCLRFILCGKGLLKLSHICRENAIQVLARQNVGYGILKRFTYDIELGNYEQAEDLLYTKSFLKLKKIDASMYEQYLDICETFERKVSVQDKFGDYISGKRIVILGPAPHEDGMQHYNSENDRIVRFSYRGKEFLPECEKDIPTHIAYYNGEAERYIERCDNKDFLNDVGYICYKTDQDEGKTDLPIRKMHILNMNANMVPHVIFDCLHYNVSSISVRNCNFYLSAKYYDDKYFLFKPKSNKEKLMMFAMHDYEGQFRIMKSLYARNAFECDDECRQVLELECEEYVERMEVIYS